MSRRKKGGGGGEDCGSWMDTYGDMVTLLLCFFVMLYSMSDINQQKWEVFVKSIFPNAGDTQQIAINENIAEGEYDVSGTLQIEDEPPVEENLDQLILALVEALNQAGIDGASVSRGEGYTFVAFENQAFFNGNSSVLTSDATRVLDVFCDVIAPQAENISQIEIMGHTAQVSDDWQSTARTDRMLSSLRSAEVAAYIQTKDIIDPSKLVGISYGQFRPVDTSETQEGRARNRRVEFLIVDKGADIKSMNEFYDEIYSDINAGSVMVTDGNASEPSEGFTPIDGSMEGQGSMIPESLEIPEGSEQLLEPAADASGTVQPPEGAPAE
ncbi:MAG: OmpA family protein [Lachnospiraceae bacterium]|jgi:chemotaxis protein MotB|nr:OmpA family protein [Lachnospiraceae bacterium]